MQFESILIAAVTLIICGAACFYIYIRQSHFEKKLMMVESILVDVKMAMDTIMTEGVMPAPAPITGPIQPAPFAAGGGGEAIPEENFYSSVLAAAHEDAAHAGGQLAGEAEPSAADEILAAMQRAEQTASPTGSAVNVAAEGIPPLADDDEEEDAAPVSAAAAVAPAIATIPATTSIGPNLDAMSKQELITLAEQRGLRAKKTMNRAEILKLLRSGAPVQNRENEAGIENGSDSRNTLFPDAAPIDGDYPVDLGQA
jgi:hypothetical protein